MSIGQRPMERVYTRIQSLKGRKPLVICITRLRRCVSASLRAWPPSLRVWPAISWKEGDPETSSGWRGKQFLCGLLRCIKKWLKRKDAKMFFIVYKRNVGNLSQNLFIFVASHLGYNNQKMIKW